MSTDNLPPPTEQHAMTPELRAQAIGELQAARLRLRERACEDAGQWLDLFVAIGSGVQAIRAGDRTQAAVHLSGAANIEHDRTGDADEVGAVLDLLGIDEAAEGLVTP